MPIIRSNSISGRIPVVETMLEKTARLGHTEQDLPRIHKQLADRFLGPEGSPGLAEPLSFSRPDVFAESTGHQPILFDDIREDASLTHDQRGALVLQRIAERLHPALAPRLGPAMAVEVAHEICALLGDREFANVDQRALTKTLGRDQASTLTARSATHIAVNDDGAVWVHKSALHGHDAGPPALQSDVLVRFQTEKTKAGEYRLGARIGAALDSRVPALSRQLKLPDAGGRSGLGGLLRAFGNAVDQFFATLFGHKGIHYQGRDTEIEQALVATRPQLGENSSIGSHGNEGVPAPDRLVAWRIGAGSASTLVLKAPPKPTPPKRTRAEHVRLASLPAPDDRGPDVAGPSRARSQPTQPERPRMTRRTDATPLNTPWPEGNDEIDARCSTLLELAAGTGIVPGAPNAGNFLVANPMPKLTEILSDEVPERLAQRVHSDAANHLKVASQFVSDVNRDARVILNGKLVPHLGSLAEQEKLCADEFNGDELMARFATACANQIGVDAIAKWVNANIEPLTMMMFHPIDTSHTITRQANGDCLVRSRTCAAPSGVAFADGVDVARLPEGGNVVYEVEYHVSAEAIRNRENPVAVVGARIALDF